MDIRLKDGTILSGVLTEDLDALVKLGVIPLAESSTIASAWSDIVSSLDVNACESPTESRCYEFSPKTVTIGNQVWMAENLSVDDGGEGIYHNEKNGEYYYTYDAAMRIANTIPGWHLPTALEWNEAALACGAIEEPYKDGSNPSMNYYIDVQVLKDKLDIKFVGLYACNFRHVGSRAYFWTSTDYSSTFAYNRYFSTGTSMDSDNRSKYYGYSVRLVKDSV